jgi:4'-phosphopantetheinyl transferase
MSSPWNELQTSAHAWHINPAKLSYAVLEQLSERWLDPGELTYLRKLPKRTLQHNYLAVRILCRAVLSHYTNVDPADWRFKPTSHGKPKIASPRNYSSLHFNLTHIEGMIVCLISRAGELGIDAEKISRRVNIDEITRHFFSRSEQAELAKLAPKRRNKRFFEIWVLKEAYLKGRSRGLSISPERVSIQFHPRGNPAPIRTWQLALHHPTARHVAATAIRVQPSDPPIPIIWRNAAELFKT